jgi:hypothetical protein
MNQSSGQDSGSGGPIRRLATHKKYCPQPYIKPQIVFLIVYLEDLDVTTSPKTSLQTLVKLSSKDRLGLIVHEWQDCNVVCKITNDMVTVFCPDLGAEQPIILLRIHSESSLLEIVYLNWCSGLPSHEVAVKSETETKHWFVFISLIAKAFGLHTLELTDVSELRMRDPIGEIYKISFAKLNCLLAKFQWTWWSSKGAQLRYGPQTIKGRIKLLKELDQALRTSGEKGLMYVSFHFRNAFTLYQKFKDCKDSEEDRRIALNAWASMIMIIENVGDIVDYVLQQWESKHKKKLPFAVRDLAIQNGHQSCNRRRMSARTFADAFVARAPTKLVVIGPEGPDMDLRTSVQFCLPPEECNYFLHPLWKEVLKNAEYEFRLLPLCAPDLILEKQRAHGGGYLIIIKRTRIADEGTHSKVLQMQLMVNKPFVMPYFRYQWAINDRLMPVAMKLLKTIAELFGATPQQY